MKLALPLFPKKHLVLFWLFGGGFSLLMGLPHPAFGDDAPKSAPAEISHANLKGDVVWPDTWMVYTNLKETDVDLANVHQLPQSINGAAGVPMQFTNGTLSLLAPGQKPTVKQPGFIFATIHSDRDQTVQIGLAANWWMQCRLNGNVICDTLQSGEGRKADQRILELPLKQGDNLLAFKVLSGKGGWGLTLIPPAEVAPDAIVPFHEDSENIIVDTDFHDADVKTYDAGQVIGNGPAVAQMTVREPYRPSKVIINAGDDKKPYLMTISDNTTTLIHPTCDVEKIIPYDYSIKNNLYLKGSVVFSQLPIPTGVTQGNMDIMVMGTALNILTAPRQIGFINIRPSFLKTYVVEGKRYRIDFSIDFSDKVQHTWEWSLYEQGNAKALYTSGTLKTRDPLGEPALFALTGSGTPYLAIHNIHLSAGIKDKIVSEQ